MTEVVIPKDEELDVGAVTLEFKKGVVEIAREDDRSLFSSPYCTGITSDPRGTGNVSESRSITVDPDTRSTLSSWRSSPDTR